MVLLAILISTFAVQESVAKEKLLVFVSISPQRYFVKQIAKDLVEVDVMVPPGANPHIYEPKPRQMVAISKAKLYFTIGIEFEKANLQKIVLTNPKLKVVHTDHGIKKISMPAHHHDEVEQDHEKGEHHGEDEQDGHYEHEGLDPHIWLSPSLVKVQARIILKALQENDPSHRNEYESNFQQFAVQIDELNADLNKLFAGKKGLRFLVFHPAWGYFAHAYGLEQIPIEIEGKEPKPAQLKELIEHAKKEKIQVVFVQPQFSTKKAELIAREIGGQVAFADPLAEDWMANLRHVADKFKAALK
jgi:zinc transport system substrate-binding protein